MNLQRQMISSLVYCQTSLPNQDPLVASSYLDRKSTRLNSSHDQISYAVFCLKKKIQHLGESPFFCVPCCVHLSYSLLGATNHVSTNDILPNDGTASVEICGSIRGYISHA